jgi:hypothetical protein
MYKLLAKKLKIMLVLIPLSKHDFFPFFLNLFPFHKNLLSQSKPQDLATLELWSLISVIISYVNPYMLELGMRNASSDM